MGRILGTRLHLKFVSKDIYDFPNLLHPSEAHRIIAYRRRTLTLCDQVVDTLVPTAGNIADRLTDAALEAAVDADAAAAAAPDVPGAYKVGCAY